MAAIKMTFSLPEPLARRFVRLIPARERSKFLAAALERSLARQDDELIKACELANADPEVAEIEKQMDGLMDRIEEPWDESAPR